MNCNNCGNPVEPGTKFCRVCGSPISDPGSVQEPTVQETSIQPPGENVNEPIVQPVEQVETTVEPVETTVEPVETQVNNVVEEPATMVPPVSEAEQPVGELPKEKKNNNLVFIIIVSLMVIIIAGLVVFIILNKKNIDKNNETTTTESTTTTTTETTTTALIATTETTVINGLSISIPAGYEMKESDNIKFLVNMDKRIIMWGFELMSGSVSSLIDQKEALISKYTEHNFTNIELNQVTAKGGLNAILITYMDQGSSVAEYYVQLTSNLVAYVAMENYNSAYFSSYDEDINVMLSGITGSASTFAPGNNLETRAKNSLKYNFQ